MYFHKKITALSQTIKRPKQMVHLSHYIYLEKSHLRNYELKQNSMVRQHSIVNTHEEKQLEKYVLVYSSTNCQGTQHKICLLIIH